MKPVTIAEFRRKFLNLKDGERWPNAAWLFHEFKACGYVLVKLEPKKRPKSPKKPLRTP